MLCCFLDLPLSYRIDFYFYHGRTHKRTPGNRNRVGCCIGCPFPSPPYGPKFLLRLWGIFVGQGGGSECVPYVLTIVTLSLRTVRQERVRFSKREPTKPSTAQHSPALVFQNLKAREASNARKRCFYSKKWKSGRGCVSICPPISSLTSVRNIKPKKIGLKSHCHSPFVRIVPTREC